MTEFLDSMLEIKTVFINLIEICKCEGSAKYLIFQTLFAELFETKSLLDKF